MVLRARFQLALIVGTAAFLSAQGCQPSNRSQTPRPPEPDVLPAVASIEIIPAYVSVVPGTSFTLRAQLRDSWGTQLSDSRTDAVSWRTTRGPLVSPGPSSTVVINTPAAGVPTATSTIVIIASLDTVSATHTIEVLPAGPPTVTTETSPSEGTVPTNPISAPDWIRAPHITSDIPTIALIDGRFAGAQHNDSTFAFAGSRELAAFDCNLGSMCGEITIFSPTLGIRRDTVGWKTGCDYVDYAGGSAGPSTGCPSPSASGTLIPIPGRIKVPVVIWQASNSPTVDNLIVQDTAYLMSVFNKPWTGLELDVKLEFAWAAVDLTYYSLCDDPVWDITNQLHEAIPYDEFKPDRITVVYVDDISMGSVKAFACAYDTAEGAVVLISKDGVGGSTLAHEIGHALIQWMVPPSFVHVNGMPNFEESNLLWSPETDHTRSIRKNLTLGQLFQLSLRDSSFVKRSPRALVKGLACPPIAASETPCPRLAKDVVR